MENGSVLTTAFSGESEMGELSNSRHEKFAQELAAGNSADASYEAAGYRKHRGNAARLSANEHVKNRVKEIQAVGAERAAVTVQSLIDEAEDARIKAMESPNGAAAAVSAITAKAKLAGLWREKVDQHSTGTVSTVWVGWEGDEGAIDERM
jgi:phage terminase small subunit